MKILTFIICIALFLPASNVSAQKPARKFAISGVVLDINDQPIANAIVMVNGVKTTAMTDANGYYSVKVKPTAKTIGVVALGSGIVEQEIEERTEINFYFNKESIVTQEVDPAVISNEQSVNTGYNEVEKKNLTTPISRVKGSKIRSYSSIYEMLQTVPGVRVTGNTVVVQDAQNLQGYVEPLFVVDGVQVSSIDDIVPATVESIEVLKGAAATIYGTRAYGGVVLIKRKVD
jgi:TonB-dependent SusC/RagA subfamily outer membrane receptor